MKKTVVLISSLSALFFIAAGIPAHAGDESTKNMDLEKAVAECQQKVQELEIKCTAPKEDYSGGELKTYGFARPAVLADEPSYGSPYWGYMLDN